MKNPAMQTVRLSELKVDPRVNRPLDQAWVDALVSTWTPAALGVPIVSKNGDGRYVILDGQHRVEALREMHADDARVKVLVYEDLSLGEEAQLFVDFNHTRGVKAFVKFERLVTAGDTDACFILSILNEQGLHLSRGIESNAVNCVVTLQALLHYDRTGLLLKRVLTVPIGAWGSDSHGFSGDVLAGIARLFRRFPAASTKRLIQKLAGLPGGPTGALAKGRGLREVMGGRLSAAVAEHLRLLYNLGLRTGRLED